MGIDYNAVLIYGWTFSYDEIFDKIAKLLKDSNEYIDQNNIEEVFNEYFPDTELIIGNASPIYNSDMLDRTYYLSFPNLTTDRLYELMKRHKEEGLCNSLLKEMEITDLPQIYALPDIY